MEDFKEKIIDYVEGRIAPDTFCEWLEATPELFDWLQNLIPHDKVIDDIVEEKIDYFLRDLEPQKQNEIYAAYQDLCYSLEIGDGKQIHYAKILVDQLYSLDQKIHFSNIMNLLISNYKSILENTDRYKPSYLQEILNSIKDFFEKKHDTIQAVPYRVKNVYMQNKVHSKLWTYVNIQSWLYNLMSELFPNEHIEIDKTLKEKASFMSDVCPEYIEGCEIEELGIIEKLIEQVPETIPKGKRIKHIKELIKKEFHIEGTKYPRWIQGGEWPISPSGKPMRFLEQKRKKGKGYENMLYTIFVFEDVDTLELRTVEQFT